MKEGRGRLNARSKKEILLLHEIEVIGKEENVKQNFKEVKDNDQEQDEQQHQQQ